jgi:hypothetical protein
LNVGHILIEKYALSVQLRFVPHVSLCPAELFHADLYIKTTIFAVFSQIGAGSLPIGAFCAQPGGDSKNQSRESVPALRKISNILSALRLALTIFNDIFIDINTH